MGLLRRAGSDQTFVLRSRSLLGRHADCDVRVDDPRISSEHASLRWTGRGWELRDLGSRNGTFVGDRRLDPGERRLLAEGTAFSLGSAEIRLEIVDGRPPAVSARHMPSRRTREAIGGLLVLPDDERPEVSVFEAGDGAWRMEDAETARPVADGEIVIAAGEAWQLDLAGAAGETLEETGGRSSLAEVTLRFQVSRDEEHVALTVAGGGRETPLPPRSYHYMLLTLARARIAERGAAASEQGWVEREALCRMLATDEYKLNVDICRARKQMAALGILGAASIIERRPGTGLVRIGIARIEVTRL